MKLKSNLLSTPQGLGKSLPHDEALEASVLGAILLEKDALADVIDILTPNVFYNTANQKIYRTIVRLFNEASPVDLHIIASAMKKSGDLDAIGGVAYLAELTHNIASAAHLETHARLLLEFAMRRGSIAIANNMLKEAYDDKVDVFDFLDKTEQAVFEVSDGLIKNDCEGVSPILSKKLKEIETIKQRGDGLLGIPSGFSRLDQLTHGWQSPDFVVVAARPGMGKTSFLLSILRNAAIDHGKAVAIFSLEMSKGQLAGRLISQESGIASEKIKTGNLSEKEWEKLYKETARLNEAPIYIDDTPGLSLFELRAKARRLKARHNIEMIIVDYLQLMSGEGGRNQRNREQEIAAISRGLKTIAKELSIPVIAASQLSRAVETRGGDKRPQLSDLRESGAIEQDVDMAMFLYRPEYYGITECDNGSSTEGMAEIIIAKHRNGPTGKVALHFHAKLTKFSDREDGRGFVGEKGISF